MITGNKGEWSELYVLLKLLADGKLHAADEELRLLQAMYRPILRIIRDEAEVGKLEYKIDDKKHNVALYINGDMIKTISADVLKEYAKTCLDGIIKGTDSAFHIEGSEDIMKDLHCTQIKAPSEDKTDISMEVHDFMTGYNTIVGYSIKSELGRAPSLLNASGATNFRFAISGTDKLSDDDIKKINAERVISKRIELIEKHSSLLFKEPTHRVFEKNLKLIDSHMEEIIAGMLLEYFKYRNITCADIATALEQKDPLHHSVDGFYRYKIKKFLCAIALGLKPSKKWDGHDEANGGYIIVKDSGEVVAYYLYNRDAFETYLLNNTKLETASTSRHNFGKIYTENGNQYFNLNLQIRFT